MAFIESVVVNVSRGASYPNLPSFRSLIVGDIGEAEKALGPMLVTKESYPEALSSIKDKDLYKMVEAFFMQSPCAKDIYVYGKLKGEDYSTALDNVILKADDFYFILIDSKKLEDLIAVGDYVQGKEKMFIGHLSDPTQGIPEDALRTSQDDLMKYVRTNNVDLSKYKGNMPLMKEQDPELYQKVRTASALPVDDRNNDNEAYIVSEVADSFISASWVGKLSPLEVGSNWNFKTLKGEKTTSLDLTTLLAMEDANMSWYQEEQGMDITKGGKTTSGLYIADELALQNIKANLKAETFYTLVSNDNIPYDAKGFNLIDSALRKVMKESADKGLIQRLSGTEDNISDISDDLIFSYKVMVPKSPKEISEDDKAKRLLPCKVTYTPSGSVNQVEINLLVEKI